MPTFTKEQKMAIDLEGSIIVSAGAGSGKTAVLSERVIRKLKDGVDINKLLILTFTKEAAKEMKSRIRNKIISNNLLRQLDLIDSAHITTFDSYALFIVTKYHYLLNISKNIKIIDSSIIQIKKIEYMNEIFDEYYKANNKKFNLLINDLCFKDDKVLIDNIIKIGNNLDLKIDKCSYLDHYLDDYYNSENLKSLQDEFNKLIFNKISDISNNLNYLKTYVDGNYYEKIEDVLYPLIQDNNIDMVKTHLNISLPRLSKANDMAKLYKNNIANLIKDLNNLVSYDNNLLDTKDYAEIIIEIIKKLDYKINKFKMENNSYEFIDVAKMAIKVVKDNKVVSEELKHYYNEILVDEYQDTSDLQEIFIDLISNHNVYMVGDIKQSIYRFRNANPNIFKEKYLKYSKNQGGQKIDLLKNFRSRKEVLDGINDIFNLVMNLDLGGADYKESHRMIFGNTSYGLKDDCKLEILNYDEGDYTKEEAEIFITALDIQEKIKNKYQVIDKETFLYRDVNYSDFCIIMDRNTEFLKYKQIFEYLNIPLVMYKDEVLSDGIDIILIKNILNIILKIKDKIFDQEFRYYLTSIMRSFLFEYSDQKIFDIFKDNKIFDNECFKKCQTIANNLDKLNNSLLLDEVIDNFEFYDKCIKNGNVNDTIIRLDYLKTIASNLEQLGYVPNDFIKYLNNLDKTEIKYSLNTEAKNSVKIMNIHKSKGLEFPICYYTGLHKKFNVSDLRDNIFYYNKYGLVLPVKNGELKNTFVTELVKNDYLKEEISEKIRLFYVGLTRAREKIIIVTHLTSNEQPLNDTVKLNYHSFLDILNSIYVNLEPFIINKDVLVDTNYKNLFNNNYEKSINSVKDLFLDKRLNLDYELISNQHFSKSNKEIISKSEQKNLDLGLEIHHILEMIDFKNPNLKIVKKDYLPFITAFLNSDLLKNLDCKIYKEYEFKYTLDNNLYHGFIDLLMEYDNYINIIDYKLKNVDDKAYIKQLTGYKNYIETKTNKKTNLYLYSIIDKKIVPII